MKVFAVFLLFAALVLAALAIAPSHAHAPVYTAVGSRMPRPRPLRSLRLQSHGNARRLAPERTTHTSLAMRAGEHATTDTSASVIVPTTSVAGHGPSVAGPSGSSHPTPAPAKKPSPTTMAAPSPTARPTPRPSLRPVAPRKLVPPQSWLAARPLLTIYGRAFGVAPILGRLGMDNSMADLEWQVQPFAQGIKASDGGVNPRLVVHLIYGMAIGCNPGSNCLLYLDDTGVDIVKQYILPAARRHWLVVLDDQLGRSDPVSEVRRMIAKGYLRYDNVEIAIDPEFRTGPDQATPGIPVGSVSADELNSAQALINAYDARRRLAHRKVMLVHQFQEGMIQNRPALRNDFPYVDTVLIADGFGPPDTKAQVYSALLGPQAPGGVRWRGIKLFYPNSYEQAGHGDYPLLTWPQVIGGAPIPDASGDIYHLRPAPNVIIIA